MTKLEQKLRKLRVWTKFKNEVKRQGQTWRFTHMLKKYDDTIAHCFDFTTSSEGHEFWANISRQLR